MARPSPEPRLKLLPLQLIQGFGHQRLDAKTRKLTPLFNPRRQKWATAFPLARCHLVGRTPVGRVTVAVLHINEPFRVAVRQVLIDEGVFPPA